MALQLIGVGATAEDGTGDGAKTAGGKINANFTELYAERWIYVKLASDFVTSSGTAVDVTGLFFTPLASTQYEIQGKFLMRTATATVGPKPGIAWPTGMTDGIATLRVATSATAFLTANGNVNAALLVAVTGVPNTTQSWPGILEASVLAGATPSGNSGTNVTMKA